MSWFSGPPTGSDETPPPQTTPRSTASFYTGVAELPAETLLACWADEPRLEDSRLGSVSGVADFLDYLKATREWLWLSDAVADTVSLVSTSSREVEEMALELDLGGDRQQLGAAVVSEWDSARRLTSVRVYHGSWPLPAQFVHLPLRPPEDPPTLPGVIVELEQARADRDVDAVLACYEADAKVSSFDGAPPLLQGRDQLRRLYATPEVAGRPRTTTVCSVTDDGRSCAVEYLRGPGDAPGPDEAGVTTYVRSPGGRIAAERRYLVSLTSGAGSSGAGSPGLLSSSRPVPRPVVPPARARWEHQVRRAAGG